MRLTEVTLNLLEDAERRPPVPLIVVPQGLMEHMPAAEFGLDKFAHNLRSSRKGAAPGPSGMTCEHLRPLLSKPEDIHLLFRMGEQLARVQVPNVLINAIQNGWGPRDCGRRHHEKAGGPHYCTTDQSHSRTVHCTFPVRNDDA